MVSREQKRAAVHEKLQTLRSITHSHAGSKSTIIAETSKYIEALKDKVERLNQEITAASTSQTTSLNHYKVKVERMEKGFVVKVNAERSSPELLVCVLEALEELNLEVFEARVSCTDSFRFQAIGRQSEDEEESEIMDAQVVKQTLLQALNICTQNVHN